MEFAVIDPSDVTNPTLRADLLDTWIAATDAGGSVGFVAPAPVHKVAVTLDLALERVAAGQDVLGTLHDGSRFVGMGLLVSNSGALFEHWRTVLRVMVHPKYQRSGSGTLLLSGLHEAARDLGLEHLKLTVRGGEGLENFYERFGYRVAGTHPRAIRLNEHDYRDELTLVMSLNPR
ncbi:GNAT family N-acetyltransferase [Kribbella deserti]|uniref:GNAT family N-acetyltransferase n=1 Tax=Kribbella deserti TaxID=1926257 RepID=A0ABV6QWD6_9ACTN